MATPHENALLVEDIKNIKNKITDGEVIDAEDEQQIIELLSAPPDFSLPHIYTLLQTLNKTEADKKQYSELVKMITEHMQKLSLDALKTQEIQKIMRSISDQLTQLSEIFTEKNLNNLINEAAKKMLPVISTLPNLTSHFEESRRTLQPNGQEGQPLVGSFVNHVKSQAQKGAKKVLQQAVTKATDYVAAQAPAIISKALESIVNISDLQKHLKTSGVEKIMDFEAEATGTTETLKVMKKGTSTILTHIEMAKNAAQFPEVTYTLTPDGLQDPKDLLSIMKMAASTAVNGELNLSGGSLADAINICRTSMENKPLPIIVNVTTTDENVREAIRELGKKLGASFLPDDRERPRMT